MRRTIILLFIVIMNYNFSLSQIQTDSSDSLWAIVMPLGKSHDIDMKQQLVGKNKDSLIADLILNIGSYDLRVDSIFFSGSDSNSFGVVSGFPPYLLSVGNSRDLEIRFIPTKLGLHRAKINIITQTDTLIYNIVGEGFEPQIEIVNRIIDFGVVSLGNQKDTIQAITIKSISSTPITIINTKHNGPNSIDFSTISGGESFVLQPGEIHKMDLRYKPTSNGRTSGTLEFHYNGIGSPAIVQLFARGIGMKVLIEDDSAYVGENKFLTLRLENSNLINYDDRIAGYKAILKYNSTILCSIDKQIQKKIESNNEIIEINKSWDKSRLVLGEFEVKTGLGNSESTTLSIVDFYWIDSNGMKLDIEVEKQSGKFEILGICEEGGKRLINPNNEVMLLNIVPNPSDRNITIGLNLIENGFTTINIFNSNGQIIFERAIESTTGSINLEIDTKEFSNGLYFINLQTPTVRRTETLIIFR